MHKLELEINDKIYARVLHFLQSFSKQDLTITQVSKQPEENLVDEMDLEGNKEFYLSY